MGEVGKRRFAETAVRSSSGIALDAHLPLLEAIAASPSDPAPWSVYADLLQTMGHPRGELISLMMERERRPSARLFELQRKHQHVHASTLLPVVSDVAVAWRRGFVSEVRIATPEQLVGVQKDLSLRFVESATLAIDAESWDEWQTALATTRMPWRRMRVELADEAFELAPILACAPALETLRVVFPDSAGELSWDGARSPLRKLVLVNVGEVGTLDDADLPHLEELRLLGESSASDELQTSLRWNRLKRIVVAELIEDERAQVIAPLEHPTTQEDDDYGDNTEMTVAFVVVGGSVDAAVLRKLAARLSIAHLSARIASVPQHSVTVLQFFGEPDAELLPYGLAIALGNVLDPAPPIALFEIEKDRAARFLVIGDKPVRETQDRPVELVRRAFDIAFGYDPSTAIVDDVLEELAVTPVEHLLGDGGTSQLTMIDPSTAPLVVPDDDGPYDDDDEYEEEDEDYAHFDDDYDDRSHEYPEPPLLVDDEADEEEQPVVVKVVMPVVRVAAAIDVVDEEIPGDPVIEEVEETFEEDPVVRPDDEDALALPPEREELWIEFRDHWYERVIDVDDEPSELRWPDPERAEDRASDLERRVAEPTCPRHERALEDCRSCDDLHCSECGGEDYCPACFATLVFTTPTAAKHAS